MKFKKYSIPYIFWIVSFVVIPLALVAYYAITKGPIDDFAAMEISFESFTKFFTPKYLLILWKSVKIASITTILTLIIGYPVAFIISRLKKSIQPTMILLVIIPMWMNFLLRTYSWLSILSKNGLINSLLKFLGFEGVDMLFTDGAVLLGMVYNFLPFMILPIYSVLAKLDKDLEEAAGDLGADKVTTFLKVILPMSLPGVVTGITMVFVPAVSTFEISSLLGGNKVSLIGNVIEQQFRVTGNWHFGAAMAMVLMIFILISLFFSNKFGDEEGELW